MPKSILVTISVLIAFAADVSASESDRKELGELWGKLKATATEKMQEFESRGTKREMPVANHGVPFPSKEIDYGFYLVNYNCYHRGFNYTYYESVPDQGSIERYQPFHQDPSLGLDCPSQKTTDSYKQRAGQEQYHRGHGTHQNIWDHNPDWMRLTNMMTNVVPQNGVLNSRGLWRELEKRVECARDETVVKVYLGNDWGNNDSNDHFVQSHGVTTPDYLWRVHVYSSHPNQSYVWHMPNDASPSSKADAKYRVTLAQLKTQTQDDFTWPMPSHWVDGNGSDPYQNIKCSWK